MSITEETSKILPPFIDFEAQALLITVPDDYSETVLLQSWLSLFFQTTNPITENMITLQVAKSWNGNLKSFSFCSFKCSSDPKKPEKNKTCEHYSSKSTKKKYGSLNDPAVFCFNCNASYSEAITESWFWLRRFPNISLYYCKIPIWTFS